MIRQEIHVTIEGDTEHTVATSLVMIGLAMRKSPKCKIWGLLARSVFLDHAEYPGLPDIVYKQRESDGRVRTYIVEVETNLTLKNFDKKSLQFKRLGVDEVFFKDLKTCPDDIRVSWVKLQNWLMEGLP
jgi:hypothetical protein